MESKFDTNAAELRKIIDENDWPSPDKKDEALEFLEAIVNNHKDEIAELAEDIKDLEDEASDYEDKDFDPDDFTYADYGLGTLIYQDQQLNLKFQYEFEEFIEEFKKMNK